MVKQKALFYPTAPKTLPEALFLPQLLCKFSFDYCTNSGEAVCGNSLNLIGNRDSHNLVVADVLSVSPSNYSLIVIGSGSYNETFHCYSDSLIRQAMQNHIDIVCLMSMPNDLRQEYHSLAQKEKINFFDLCLPEASPNFPGYTPPISSKIIVIGGIVREADVTEVFFQTVTELRNRGFRVSGIGTNPLCNLMGLHLFPSHSPENGEINLNTVSTLDYLRKYIVQIEKNECPEYIVIESPDSIMRINAEYANGYCLGTHALSQILFSAKLICCSVQNFTDPDFKDKLSQFVNCRYGWDIVAFHFSNFAIDFNSAANENTFTGYRDHFNSTQSSNLLTSAGISTAIDSITKEN